MAKKKKKKFKKIKHGGDDSDYRRRKKEGRTQLIKLKRDKKIKIQRDKHKDDPRKCPKCGKVGPISKTTRYGSKTHFTHKCPKHGYYSYSK